MSEDTDYKFKISWENDQVSGVYLEENQSLQEAVSYSVNPISLSEKGVTLNSKFEKLFIAILNLVNSIKDEKKKILYADYIFGSIYPLPKIPNPKLQTEFWKTIIKKVWEWEDENEFLHKGTPYYFIAESFLAMGDIPSAYTYFYNAIEEDKRNYNSIAGKEYKNAPAYKTTSLANDPDNALYEKVVIPLKKYLYSFITKCSFQISLCDLETKFFLNDNFEDIKRVFVANFHEMYHLKTLYSTRLIDNDYTKLKIIDTLFNIALVIDQILESKFHQGNMAGNTYYLWLHKNWINSTTTTHAGDWTRKIDPCPNHTKPDDVLQSYLDGSVQYDGLQIDAEKRSTIITYHLRNYSAHNLEGNNILVTRYEEILEKIMLAFFIAVDIL